MKFLVKYENFTQVHNLCAEPEDHQFTIFYVLRQGLHCNPRDIL